MNTKKMIRLASVSVVAMLCAFAAWADEVGIGVGEGYEITQQILTKVIDGKEVVYTNLVTNAVAKAKGAVATLPLAEARAKIGEIIADPSKMTEIMQQLSPEDQKTFTAEVNAAIMKLPGSTEDKTAKYLNIDRAALKGASEGNMQNVLAVIYATVPPESLTVLSERYAEDLFNRGADTSVTFSDADFESISKEVMDKVIQTTAGTDDASVRNTFAILMFMRASNGQEGLGETLVALLPDQNSRELALGEWIPAAMGPEKSYDAMLAYADAKQPPNIDMVLNLSGPQMLDALLNDMTAGMQNKEGRITTPILDQAFGGFDEARINVNQTGMEIGGIPRTTDPTKRWNPDYKRDDPMPPPHPKPQPEPEPYPYCDCGY